MWTCPRCSRRFKNRNQQHRCERTSSEDQIAGQSHYVQALYKKLLKEVAKIGKFTESPIKDYIMLKNESTFATLKPRKKYLGITFFLRKPHDDFPVLRNLRTSTNRVAHEVRLETLTDLNKQILSWIKESYHLTSRGKA